MPKQIATVCCDRLLLAQFANFIVFCAPSLAELCGNCSTARPLTYATATVVVGARRDFNLSSLSSSSSSSSCRRDEQRNCPWRYTCERQSTAVGRRGSFLTPEKWNAMSFSRHFLLLLPYRLQPLCRTICAREHPQLITGGFCWIGVLLLTMPACWCWKQPAHSD